MERRGKQGLLEVTEVNIHTAARNIGEGWKPVGEMSRKMEPRVVDKKRHWGVDGVCGKG